MSNHFLRIFSYETHSYDEDPDQKIFNNCVLLRDFDGIRKGTKITRIKVGIRIYGFSEEGEDDWDLQQELSFPL